MQIFQDIARNFVALQIFLSISVLKMRKNFEMFAGMKKIILMEFAFAKSFIFNTSIPKIKI